MAVKTVRDDDRLRYVTCPDTGRRFAVPAGGATDDPPDDDGGDDGDDDDGELVDVPRAKAKIRKANQEAKALRERVKELEQAESRLQELEDAEKSQLDKATERITAAEKRAEEAETRALRLQIAHEKGLTPAQAKRLSGSSQEELEADADELLELFAPSKSREGSAGSGPKPRIDDDTPSDAGADQDPQEVAKQVIARQRGVG